MNVETRVVYVSHTWTILCFSKTRFGSKKPRIRYFKENSSKEHTVNESVDHFEQKAKSI